MGRRTHAASAAVLVAGLAGLAAGPAAAATTVSVPYVGYAPALGTPGWWSPYRLFDFAAAYAFGDNTITVSGAWHEDALYLAAQVTDGQLYADALARDAPTMPQNDAIELLFDPGLKGGTAVAAGDPAFRWYVFTIAGGVLDANGVGATADVSFTGGESTYLTLAGTLNGPGTGYVLEMRIPWTDLGVTPAVGLVLGFDLANDDRDDALAGAAVVRADWAQLQAGPAQPGQWYRLALAPLPDGGVGSDAGPADAAAADARSSSGGGEGGGGGGDGTPLPTPKSGCLAGGATAGLAATATLLGLGLAARRRRRR